MLLPDNLVRTVAAVHGERGREWLAGLPELLDETARRWSLDLLPAFPNLSFHYVAPVVCADGGEAVLKAGVPHKEMAAEIAALRLYDGTSSVRLMDADGERGVFLIERLRPGATLATLADEANDERATAIAASVMRGIWRPAPPEHSFPHVRDWAGGMERLRAHFSGGVGPLPAALVEEAEALFADLLESMAAPVLLHGDLHHDNVLSAERGWLAIDPKGLIGEPAYEVGALLRNLWPDRHTFSNPGRVLERRVHQLSEELDIDRARVRGWAVAQAVLSAWWCIEDNDDCWEAAIAHAQLLADVKA